MGSLFNGWHNTSPWYELHFSLTCSTPGINSEGYPYFPPARKFFFP